jgi:hypothetical protein
MLYPNNITTFTSFLFFDAHCIAADSLDILVLSLYNVLGKTEAFAENNLK